MSETGFRKVKMEDGTDQIVDLDEAEILFDTGAAVGVPSGDAMTIRDVYGSGYDVN